MKHPTKILDLLTPGERHRTGLLLGMVLIMALMDMISVASIMPFISVIANPELLATNTWLSKAYEASCALGVTTTEEFIFLLGILVFGLLIGSLAFRALTSYAQSHFTLMLEFSLGRRLVEAYLYQPYSWFLGRNSSDMGKSVMSEVKEVIDKVVLHAMTLIAQSAAVIALLLLLVLVDPILAVTVGSVLILSYVLIYKLMGSFVSRIGSERFQANHDRFSALSEAFGAAKEVKAAGLEAVYIQRFSLPAKTYAKHQASLQVVSQLPRFVIEAIAFGGMVLLVLVLMAREGQFANVLPVIALYAFAAYRLMPALQKVYSAFTQLRFAGPTLDALHQDLMSLPTYERAHTPSSCMALHEAITLNNIHFTYPHATKPALKNISLRIEARSTVGFVGKTGSGKTTTVDLILGLLVAQHGTLEVDGQAINPANLRQWQRSIAYVPQQIYLADDTVAANIAFGITLKDINPAAIERAAKIANLHEFVVGDLPDKYQTRIGERGIRLSGGQRQRIGIARALYRSPEVLVLDEATCALDNLTEQAVIEAVRNIGKNITVIMIAHRLNTVKDCDKIFLLDNGTIKEVGNFETLSQYNPLFWQ